MSTMQAPAGRASMLDLWRMWRNEDGDPAGFYRELAVRASADVDRRFGPLSGERVLDVGCGPGWYTQALRERGADVIPIDYSEEELHLHGDPPEGAIVGDAMDLPLAAGSLDGVFASNMLEHTPDFRRVISEMARVLRPGGWIYLSWTNWFSPWGGHDMTPFHLLGPRLGARLYERRHGGRAPKNLLGHTLWPVHVGPTLRFIRSHPELEIVRVEPRYWPRLRFIVHIPLLREVATWNCVIWMRKRAEA
jgi:SAM-dependent methyltransferase